MTWNAPHRAPLRVADDAAEDLAEAVESALVARNVDDIEEGLRLALERYRAARAAEVLSRVVCGPDRQGPR